MADARAEPPTFLAEVRRRSRPADWLLLLGPPVGLLAVQALPPATRASLAFSPARASILTAFTAHYVHFSAGHLAGNLATYLLIAPAVYLLLLLGGRRGEFQAFAVTVLGAFPFVLTALAALSGRPGTVAGFSGLGMAYVGALPAALFLFLDRRLDARVGLDDAPGLFLAGLAVVAVRAVPTTAGLAIAAAAGLLAVVYAFRLRRAVPGGSWAAVRRALGRSGYVELAAATPVLFVLALLAGFPADPLAPGTVVDLFGHFVGYALGFVSLYLSVRLVRAAGGEPERPTASAAESTDLDR